MAQRVIARFHLEALSAEETALYIAHRLKVAGLQGNSPFEPAAVQRVHRLSRGVPRRINLLCDRALLGAFAVGKKRVDRAMVDSAAAEVFEGTESGRPRVGRFALAALGLTAGLALLAVLNFFDGDERLPAGTPVATPAKVRAAEAGAPVAPPAKPTPAPQALPAGNGLIAGQVQAWEQLAPVWGEKLEGDDPCLSAQLRQLHCFARPSSMQEIKALDRPGVLALEDGKGQSGYAVLTRLDDDLATLSAAGATRTIALSALSEIWHGDFATFWRAPPGYTAKLVEGDSGPAVDWLAAQMAALHGTRPPKPGRSFGASLKAQVRKFQSAHGLAPDGRAGPLTLMQINRATGVDEPRLQKAS